VTFFPSELIEDLLYLKTLHSYEGSSWVSIGIKPKAKDLKSIIEDLSKMEFLTTNTDFNANIVLDGKKVRIGLYGEKLDPFKSVN
jgi:hypothetical protein